VSCSRPHQVVSVRALDQFYRRAMANETDESRQWKRQVAYALLRSYVFAALQERGGAHVPPNFQTGMPSFLALSARFAEMPEPGNTMTPIGSKSRIWSLRLKGAAFA